MIGTVTGGRIADHIGLVRTNQLGNLLLIPAFAALLACNNKYAALPLITLVGLITNIPFAVLIKLGQDYLPTRPGTAAGVTLGLAVSAGGGGAPRGWGGGPPPTLSYTVLRQLYTIPHAARHGAPRPSPAGAC